LERGLRADNDNAVRLTHRIARFAGKPRSNAFKGRALEPANALTIKHLAGADRQIGRP
jgi:hypothetical protein